MAEVVLNRPAVGTLNDLLPIQTARVHIRRFRHQDGDALFALHSDPILTRYAGGQKTREESADSLERIIKRVTATGFGALALENGPSGEVIGWAGIQPLPNSERYEVIYALKPRYWGLGLAFEVASSLISAAFSLERPYLGEMSGLVFPENIRSVRVLQKLGMSFVEPVFDVNSGKYASLYAVSRDNFLSTVKHATSSAVFHSSK